MIRYTKSQRRAVAALAAIAAALALSLVPAAHASDGQAANQRDATPAEPGPNGGVLFRDGQNTVELLLDEASSSLQVWARSDQRMIAPAELSIEATVQRPDERSPRALVFSPAKDHLVATQGFDEPHFFDIEARVSWPGQSPAIEVSLHKREGLVAITAEQRDIAGITTALATAGTLNSSTRFPGEIAFNADRTANVVPRLAGVVQEVRAELGQTVKQGDVLAVFSSTALAEIRGRWGAARRRLELASATHAREKQLWQEKVTAEQDYQAARTALYEAQIAVQSVEQQLLAIGARPQAKQLSLLEVRAPFDGVVVEKDITLGEALPENANIFTISDLNTVWAQIVIAPKDLPTVKIGEPAVVSSTSFEGQAQGKVSYIGPLLGQQTRTATARVVLDNPGAAWRPGLFVSVSVVQSSRQAAVTAEADAIQDVEGKPTVFVQVADGFLPRSVKLGATDGKRVEIVAGLEPGVRYANANTFVLKSEMGKDSAEHAH